MILVEQIILPNKFFDLIDHTAFLSKNLFNASLYEIRQYFFQTGKFLGYCNLDKIMQNNPDYQALPRKVSQHVLRQVCQSFSSFFNALKSYKKNPEKFKARPNVCHYKHKTNGRNLLIYTDQALSIPKLKQNIIQPSGLNIEVKIRNHINKVKQVRIIPNLVDKTYTMEVIYEIEEKNSELNKERRISLDIGVNNLLAVTSDQKEIKPFLINGRPIKSINQWFNKKRAEYQSLGITSCKKLNILSSKRKRKIRHYFHNVSKKLIDYCVTNNIGVIVIGKNNGWKQEVNLGSKTNQEFVSIPFNNLISMIKYKGTIKGIEIIEQEESYTSKCSFLDSEEIKKKEQYDGYRKNRGMFTSKKSQRLINADINGSYNILRKVFPERFSEGIGGFVVTPKVWRFPHF